MTGYTIFIVAGEPSGDLHGANLIREMLRADPEIAVSGIGGEQMSATRMELRHDLASEAIMGFTEVLRKFGHIRAVFRDTVEFLAETRPDLLVLIDYPGFNLRLAQHAKKLGIRTVYYICPQVWAWGRGRVERIARLVEKAIVILDFEQSIYSDAGLSVEFVGHPLVDRVEGTPLDERFIAERRNQAYTTVGLLPGSRPQEVRRHLPIMLRSSEILHQELAGLQLMVACPNRRIHQLAEQIVSAWSDKQVHKRSSCPRVEVVSGKTYEVIGLSDLCLVASGTATLETAYFLKPMLVIYKTSFISWLLARAVIKVRHISMVNILAGKEVVPEFIQFDARPKRMAGEALALLTNGRRRAEIELVLSQIRDRLGRPGASERAARAVFELLRRNPTAQTAPTG